MRGIEANNLENIKQRIETCEASIETEMKLVEAQQEKVVECYTGDLSFLTEKLQDEISQFDNIKTNNANYSTILGEIITSYQSQDNRMREILNSVTPR